MAASLNRVTILGRVNLSRLTIIPVADFSANLTSGTSPLSVNFTDLSTNDPTSWAWDFENNGTTDSTLQNPTHVYSSPGIYSVKLTATNSAGSNVVIKTGYINVTAAAGAQVYTTPGTYSWTVPEGVTTISAVLVGGGGGGSNSGSNKGGAGGGGLRYISGFSVTPGQVFTIDVGSGGTRTINGGNSRLTRDSDSAVIIQAFGGTGTTPSNTSARAGGTGTTVGAGPFGGTIGGGNGGQALYTGTSLAGGGGGGAGGYSGTGGTGGGAVNNGTAGAGGGGGGGYAGTAGNSSGGSGGGVGILGQGANGAGGITTGLVVSGGGSGGGTGARVLNTIVVADHGIGGLYGGGGAGSAATFTMTADYLNGGGGAVRIIWGEGRSYPSNAA